MSFIRLGGPGLVSNVVLLADSILLNKLVSNFLVIVSTTIGTSTFASLSKFSWVAPKLTKGWGLTVAKDYHAELGDSSAAHLVTLHKPTQK